MSAAPLFAVIALLLIAWDVTQEPRSPFRTLTGFTLLLVAVGLRVFSGVGLLNIVSGVFADVGFGLLAAGVLLAIRRAGALPFFALGILTLGLSSAFSVGAHYLQPPLHDNPFADDATFLLELGPDDEIAEVAALLDHHDMTYERAFPSLTLETDADLAQVYLVSGPTHAYAAVMEALRADAENVDYVSLNSRVALPPLVDGSPTTASTTDILENDPLAAQQWALNAVHAHEAHRLLQDVRPRKKALIAIVDTGVDQHHEDLRDIFVASPGGRDLHGHGTHCAGIAAAVTNNAKGISSLNWNGNFLRIAGYPALSAAGFGTVETIAQAVINAAQDGADVVSMSLGDYAPIPPKTLVDAIRFAQRGGAIVVVSAGNSNADARDHMPSNIKDVLVIAAVDQNLNKARFSNTNTSLARPLAAPGVDVLSLKPGNKYVPLSGTSMSTPVVSGILGILRALNPDLKAEDAYELLHETGTTLKDSPRVGNLVNAHAAIEATLKASGYPAARWTD